MLNRADLENALQKTVNMRQSDYALLTGIQIHAPDGNYVSPADGYVVMNTKRRSLKLK